MKYGRIKCLIGDYISKLIRISKQVINSSHVRFMTVIYKFKFV